MNNKIILIFGALLLLILLIGCTQPATCGDQECQTGENDSTSENYCPNDCVTGPDANNPGFTDDNLPDVPWSYFSIHYEKGFSNHKTLTKIVELANEYNTPLTILMHPEMAEEILNDEEKLNLLRKWQEQGHEIGIHAQGCYPACNDPGTCLSEASAGIFTKLLERTDLKTAHVAPALYGGITGEGRGGLSCEKWLPKSIEYIGVGRFDGRSSISLKFSVRGREFYELHVKSGHGLEELPKRYGQYNPLNSDEIYNYNNHGEPAELDDGVIETWLQFLSEKDPEGLKRKTQSWIMEKVIIPNNRVIDSETLFNSSDPNIQKCSQLIGEKIQEDVYWYSTTDIFNFGRCLETGTYCFLDEACNITTPTNMLANVYIPTKCTLKNIDDLTGFKPVSELCKSVCGDLICDREEHPTYGTPKECDYDCMGTCSEQDGEVCTADQTCSIKMKITSDTDYCCVKGICSN